MTRDEAEHPLIPARNEYEDPLSRLGNGNKKKEMNELLRNASHLKYLKTDEKMKRDNLINREGRFINQAF